MLPVSLDCPFFISPRFSITFIDVKLLLIVSCDKLSFNVHEACHSPYTKHLFTPRLFLPAKIRGLVIRKRYAIKRRNYVIASGSFMVHFNTTVPVVTIRSGRPKDKQYNGQKKKDKRTNNDL